MFHTPIEDEGRGCVIHVINNLKCNHISPTKQCKDTIWCELSLANNDKCLIGCIYRSPSSTTDKNSDLNQQIKEMATRKYSHILIMGDFNYPRINWSNWTTTSKNPREASSAFLETVKECYLSQSVMEPTRARGEQNPNILDLILTNDQEMIKNLTFSSPLGKSDHCTLQFHTVFYTETPTQETRFNYNRGDYEALANELDIDWDECFAKYKTVDEKWMELKKRILMAVDKHVPKRSSKLMTAKKQNFPLPNTLLSKVRKKNRCWQRYMETRDASKYRDYKTKKSSTK